MESSSSSNPLKTTSSISSLTSGKKRKRRRCSYFMFGTILLVYGVTFTSILRTRHRTMYAAGEAWIEGFLNDYPSSNVSMSERPTLLPHRTLSNTTDKNTSTQIPQQERQLHFIPAIELQQRDYFSDSWLISKRRLLEIDAQKISIVEDAALVAVGTHHRQYRHAKMTLDWMDFCVEHLSKWWGGLLYQRGKGFDPAHLLNHIVGMLQNYVQHKVQAPTQQTPLSQTIAMVAFAPYRKKMSETQSHLLTSHSLAATIASLYQVGFGRVVVVGINGEDIDYVQNAVKELELAYNKDPRRDKSPINSNASASATLIRLGAIRMEVDFVHVTDPSLFETKHIAKNIPRAAVVGMQLALTRKLNATETMKWLGQHRKPSYWQSVYLTEPDTILHIRPTLLPAFQKALVDGMSLFPHRLHPISHEADLPASHSLNRGLLLPNTGHFANISIIDTSLPVERADQQNQNAIYPSCCDGGKNWPRLSAAKCHPWWSCGFKAISDGEKINETDVAKRRELFELYPMMQIRNGIGPVFASTNHGRRCYPSTTSCWRAAAQR